MGCSPSNRCGYTWPADHKIDDKPNQQSCCWRETSSAEADRCVLHADSDEVIKSTHDVQKTRESDVKRNQNSPYAELLDGVSLHSVELGDAIVFENSALRESDLSGADLSNVELKHSDLTGANLSNASLSNSNLLQTDFSDANLRGADLSEAYMRDTDLPKAHFNNVKSVS